MNVYLGGSTWERRHPCQLFSLPRLSVLKESAKQARMNVYLGAQASLPALFAPATICA